METNFASGETITTRIRFYFIKFIKTSPLKTFVTTRKHLIFSNDVKPIFSNTHKLNVPLTSCVNYHLVLLSK